VFLRKGNATCPECGSTYHAPYSTPSAEFETNYLEPEVDGALDKWELQDFHARAKNSR
jgi:hypothetical protein